MLNPIIETDRILIRPISLVDTEAFFLYKSERNASEHQGWTPKDLDDAERFILKNPKTFNEPETWFQLVIIEKASNRLIGDVGVHFYGQENLQCELGYTIATSFQRMGFATEAVKEIIAYLFYTCDKHRITASIDPENISSIKLIERLGFRLEGHFKKSLFIHNKWVDDVIYAVLREEWNNQ